VKFKTKAGLVLFVVGFSIFFAWRRWTSTRNFSPVDVPIAFAADQTSSAQFTPNLDALYLVEIQPENTISVGTDIRCSPGTVPDSADCRDLPNTVIATWILWSRSRELKHGSSAEPHTTTDPVHADSRVIGEFQGKAGQHYTLQVSFTPGATAFAVTRPRLRVTAASIVYTDLQSAGVLVFSIAFICVLFGVTLLGIGYYSKRQH
jgi:hypothetical protein